MAEFDLKRVTPLEWAGIGAGLLAFLASFFNWYSIDFNGLGGGGFSAWNTGFLAWFSVLLLMGAGGLVLAPHLGLQVARLPLIWLGIAAAAFVFILIRWLTLPDDGFGGLLSDSGIDSGAGFGLIVGLIAAIVSGAAAFLVYRASTKTSTTGTAS